MQQQRTLVELTPPEEAPTVTSPAIWVGTTEDWEGEQRHGGWVDAAARTRGVLHAIRDVVDRTPADLGAAWQICALRDFGGWQPAELEGLPVVLEIARGIAVHGPAYGALAAKLGADSLALEPQRYRLSYLGSWASLRDFADTVARDSGWAERLDQLPSSLKPYVTLDYRKLQRDIRHDLTVIDHTDGVWLYDPRVW